MHLNECCWSISFDHKLCTKDGEIFHCDVEVLQGKSHPEGRRKCVMVSLLVRLVVFAIESSQGFLKSSYCKSLIFHQRYNLSECGFDSMV